MSGNSIIMSMLAGQQFANNLLNAPIQHQLLKDQKALSHFKLSNPMLSMPGEAGQIGALQYLNNNTQQPNNTQQLNNSQQPNNLPNYARLLLEHMKNEEKASQANANYKNVYAGTVGRRFSSPLQRDQMNAALQKQGYNAAQIANMSDEQAAMLTNSPNPQGNNPLANQQQDETQSSIIKKTTPAQTTKMRKFAEDAKESYKDILDTYQKASHYAGGLGQLQLQAAKNARLLNLGYDSDNYKNYLKFWQTLPRLAQEVRAMTGGQATDYESKLFQRALLAKPSQMTPSEMKEMIKNLGNIIDKYSKTSFQSLNQQSESEKRKSSGKSSLKEIMDMLE